MSRTFLAGKVAIVTGGAVGIGRACVEALAGEGASVVTCDVRPLVEEVAGTVTAQGGGEVVGVIADVSEPEDVYATVDLATERFGGVDILVNNAAVWADHTFATRGRRRSRSTRRSWERTCAGASCSGGR